MLEEIKKLVKEEKLVVGTNATLDNLKNGKAKKIWLASNVSQETKADIMHYAELAKVEVNTLDVPNDELGVVCKKQFSVSVISQGEN